MGMPLAQCWQVLLIPSPKELDLLPPTRTRVVPAAPTSYLSDQSDLLIAVGASTKAPLPAASMFFKKQNIDCVTKWKGF